MPVLPEVLEYGKKCWSRRANPPKTRKPRTLFSVRCFITATNVTQLRPQTTDADYSWQVPPICSPLVGVRQIPDSEKFGFFLVAFVILFYFILFYFLLIALMAYDFCASCMHCVWLLKSEIHFNTVYHLNAFKFIWFGCRETWLSVGGKQCQNHERIP